MNAKKKSSSKESVLQASSAEDKAAIKDRSERYATVTGLLDFFKDADSAVGFFNFIRTLSGDDILRLFDATSELVRIDAPLNTKAGVLLRVEAALKLAEVYASVTPGHRDNEFIEKTKLLLNAGLLPVVADIVSSLLSHLKGEDDASGLALSAVMTGPQSDVIVLENGVSWSVLVPIINTILQIIRAMTKD
jgi:hypothetical protein